MSKPLLEARDLTRYYHVKSSRLGKGDSVVKAVDGISLTVNEGEVFGLVGESGCGKSTLGRVLLRLEDPTGGSVRFDGEELGEFNAQRLKAFRGKAQVIYQDPYSALNPRQKVGSIIEEPLAIHKRGTAGERRERAAHLLETVGLRPDQALRYPHEFSGGQRQRIVIARALALNPSLILADEPVSALDVSIQAQVINLLGELKETFGLTYVFISHDLSVVEHIADRVGVMYLGRLVETASKKELYKAPLHPYSQALLGAAPVPDPDARKERVLLTGDVPSPINPPPGCTFSPRCSRRMPICSRIAPELNETPSGSRVACHLY